MNSSASPADAPPTSAPPTSPRRRDAWRNWALIGACAVAVGALGLGWNTQQRLRVLEKELVKRQEDSQGEAAQALLMAKQAQDASREAGARAALLDARVSEAALQRTQIEELIQSLARSRDENVVSDVDAGLRVALQQSAITGSTEPLLQALQQADERLARYNQPRLERVRRALARDLDRVKAVGVSDLSSLTLRLDELVRLVDELPLLAATESRRTVPRPAARGASAAEASASGASWNDELNAWWQAWPVRLWEEVRSLVRVAQVQQPEALLLAPEQMYFLRENLKLRLLNARLALLSRQYATAQADLRDAQAALDRYFDPGSRRVQVATELLKQVAGQARQVSLPRPDETLAALAAAAAGR
ncbi:uroporphyrinogen-III C-methyltransferase [Azohydromonas australica]|uniref:uroporphyrinogen-III C-methyltransferase n=1 Tax=Azohydromonas australica TaxID=364039 RepID=UPI000A0312C2|nr:uroporphyrinogen-III C-methyltransferase [Azohydromonas australica]